MTRSLAAAWLSAILLCATTAPLAAQAPAPAPGEPKPAPSLLDRRRNDAAKLAGMVRFVDATCPQARPDYDRFKKVVAALGVDLKDLEGGELMMRSLDYSQVYLKEGAAACQRALALFGEAGTAIPGLIVRKTP